MRVLVVEDEKKMASFILKGLKEVGFLPEVCHRGDEALVRILSSAFDAVVLDIMLPGLDGLAIVRRMRSQGCTTPVLMLSARGDVDERVEGIEAGADDYLAKPFAVKEVIARVRALVRRASETTSHTLRLADLSFDLSRREVSRAGKRLELSAREMLLLEVLMENAGRVCGRMLLLEKVWTTILILVPILWTFTSCGYDPKLIAVARSNCCTRCVARGTLCVKVPHKKSYSLCYGSLSTWSEGS